MDIYTELVPIWRITERSNPPKSDFFVVASNTHMANICWTGLGYEPTAIVLVIQLSQKNTLTFQVAFMEECNGVK